MTLRRSSQTFGREEMTDPETGEAITPVVQTYEPVQNYPDCETGEASQKLVVFRRSKFKVPHSALTLPVFDSMVHRSNKTTETAFDCTLLILPLLMMLPGWAIVLYIMAEVMYHNWGHTHEATHVPCKTPMHTMLHMICAECVATRQMQKIGKLQDERTLKINSRRILSYDYAQFGLGL